MRPHALISIRLMVGVNSIHLAIQGVLNLEEIANVGGAGDVDIRKLGSGAWIHTNKPRIEIEGDSIWHNRRVEKEVRNSKHLTY